jgi:hypothetical protein
MLCRSSFLDQAHEAEVDAATSGLLALTNGSVARQWRQGVLLNATRDVCKAAALVAGISLGGDFQWRVRSSYMAPTCGEMAELVEEINLNACTCSDVFLQAKSLLKCICTKQYILKGAQQLISRTSAHECNLSVSASTHVRQ